ncbi:MAG: hypothetical protein J6S26_04465 [Solobacterium sp.]|nr:hypothetical protein [Solobacterium sp.]
MEEDTMKKRIITVITAILLILFLCAGWFVYQTEYRKTEVLRSGQGDHTLIIYMIGEPEFPFGNTKCHAVLNENGIVIRETDIILKNDGVRAEAENFRIEWGEENVTITASASEMDPEDYVLAFGSDAE